MPSRRAKTLTLWASLLVTPLVAEAVIRLSRPAYFERVEQPLIYQRDDCVGYRYLPGATGRIRRGSELENTVRINALGFHDVERPAADEGVRVCVLGDSFTSSIQVPVRETWTRVLERELSGDDAGFAVYNLGVDGYGTAAQLELLRELAPVLRPDVVVLAFHENDVEDVRYGTVYREGYRGFVLSYQDAGTAAAMKELVDAHLEGGPATWLWERSHLFRFGTCLFLGGDNLCRSNFVKPSHVGRRPEARHDPARELPRLLAGFEELAAERGFAFVIAPMPPRCVIDGSRRALEETAAPDPALVLDVPGAVARELEADGASQAAMYWERDGHLNAYGNTLVGRAVAACLLERLGDGPGR